MFASWLGYSFVLSRIDYRILQQFGYTHVEVWWSINTAPSILVISLHFYQALVPARRLRIWATASKAREGAAAGTSLKQVVTFQYYKASSPAAPAVGTSP
jgi:hypothetical protein